MLLVFKVKKEISDRKMKSRAQKLLDLPRPAC
jgi:hypothetical protein